MKNYKIVNMPDWIKKAKRNWKAKVKRYAKKHNISIDEAEFILNEKMEDMMQS